MGNSKILQIVIKAKDEASKTLNSFSNTLKKNEASFKKMAVGGGLVFAGMSAGITKTVKDSVQLGESINAVNVIFGDGADEIFAFGEKTAKAVGLATGEFNQMATMTGALLKDTGKPMNEVADMTIQLTERAADLASVFNTDVSDAMSAINQAVRGETEAIRRYAGDVTDASLDQYLLAESIEKTASELSAEEKRLYRVQLLLAQTSNVAGDFKNTSGELANSQRILKAELTNLSATIGKEFQPMLKTALEFIAPVVSKLSEWVSEHPKLTMIILASITALAGIVAVIGIIGLVLPAVIAGFGILAVVIGAISLPVLVVIGVIGLLVATLMKFSGDWDMVWLGLKLTFAETVNSIIGFFESMANIIVESINVVIRSINSLINKLASIPKIGKAFQKLNVPELSKVTFGRVNTGAMVQESINDGVITPDGRVIKTNPKDYIFATKNPMSLAGGGITLNINGGTFLSESVAEEIGNMIVEKFKRNVRF